MNLDQLASREYRAALSKHHAQHRWGSAGKSHANVVSAFAGELGAASVLDYGCGRATLKSALCREHECTIDVREFDPGIPGKDTMPEPADLVVATDVLEHIELDRLTVVLQHIRSLARMGAFMTIALSPSKHVFEDGRNVHLIIKPAEWWTEQLRAADFKIVKTSNRKGLWVWCR